MTYVYVKSEPGLWTVGFYKPCGEWEPESDHSSTEDAAQRVAYLNGNAPRGATERWPDYVKRIAYVMDPECWVSYTGKPREFKQRMELRRQASLTRAARMCDTGEA